MQKDLILEPWCSEILSSKGLLYPSAKWMLNHTSPIPGTGEQCV